mmetsp:Transcript_126901/g.189329  ORF Transcript_126901/g.189329 Transcript_126901/m.189329 type:complete len:245 (-) Transcript_126901:56-790(-)
MHKDGKDQDRTPEVYSPHARRNMKFTESIQVGLVGLFVWSHASPQRRCRKYQRHNLDEVVKPISRLIVRQVPFVTNDRRKAEKENEAIQLQGLNGNACSPLAFERFQIQDAEAEHTRHCAVGHQERKIATGKHEVYEQRRSKKSGPHQDICIQCLHSNALLCFVALRFIRLFGLITFHSASVCSILGAIPPILRGGSGVCGPTSIALTIARSGVCPSSIAIAGASAPTVTGIGAVAMSAVWSIG